MSEHKLKKIAQEKEAQELITSRRPNFFKVLRWPILIVILTALIVLGYFHFKHPSSKNTPIKSSSYASIYNSSSDKFDINFPARISKNQSSATIYGKDVPYVSYLSYVNSQVYVVRVYNLAAAVNFKYYAPNQLQNYLLSWVKTIAGATSGWHFMSSKFIEFSGQKNVLSAQLSSSAGNQVNNIYFYAFNKAELIYNIFTVGIPLNNFNNFVNSFKFTY